MNNKWTNTLPWLAGVFALMFVCALLFFKEVAPMKPAELMTPLIKSEIEREIDKFEASMIYVTELEVKRQELYLLYSALAVRGLDFHELNQKDNGWYFGDRFIGKTLEDSYWEVAKWI